MFFVIFEVWQMSLFKCYKFFKYISLNILYYKILGDFLRVCIKRVKSFDDLSLFIIHIKVFKILTKFKEYFSIKTTYPFWSQCLVLRRRRSEIDRQTQDKWFHQYIICYCCYYCVVVVVVVFRCYCCNTWQERRIRKKIN